MPRKVHPDGLVAARRNAVPGKCLFCEDPAGTRSGCNLETCGSRWCLCARNNAYGRDWRLNHPGYQARKSRAWRKLHPLYHRTLNDFKKEGYHARKEG